eukprot:20326-Heterococcus_DN1.PRE.2
MSSADAREFTVILLGKVTDGDRDVGKALPTAVVALTQRHKHSKHKNYIGMQDVYGKSNMLSVTITQ